MLAREVPKVAFQWLIGCDPFCKFVAVFKRKAILLHAQKDRIDELVRHTSNSIIVFIDWAFSRDGVPVLRKPTSDRRIVTAGEHVAENLRPR